MRPVETRDPAETVDADRVVYGKVGRYAYAGITHPGLKRRRNEDTFWVDEDHLLFLVADGMGGHRRGAEAARSAVTTIGRELGKEPGLAAFLPVSWRTRLELRGAFRAANDAVRQAAAGGGTTLEALLVRDQRAHLAHIGDSRIYRLRAGKLEQLTRDHTVGASRHADREEADADAAALTRALGPSAVSPRPDQRALSIQRGDRFLLCSDGLAGPVKDDEIRAILLDGWEEPMATCRALVDAALRQGGPDNVTVLVVAAP